MLWIIIIGVLLFLWLLSRSSKPTNYPYPVKQSSEEKSFVYYHNSHGQPNIKSDTCNGCILNEADTLLKAGYQIDEVVLGRRNSGDLQ